MTKVLVIDDDRTTLRIISRWYEGTETEVLTASAAREGLDRIRNDRPNVLLLDIMLPELSGLETYDAIRQIDPKLPVIYITSHGSSEMAIEAMKLGAYDYVQKPLDKEKLLDLVARAAEMRRLMNVPVSVPRDSDTPTDELDSDAMLGQSEAMHASSRRLDGWRSRMSRC